MKSLLIAALLLTTITARAAEPVDMAKRTEELKSQHWGMFICWSFSTFSGKEWTPGVKDINLFAAKDCDTDQWARTAKEAGMGYILFLTKHHDGFCLWDTKTTDRKVTKAPLGRDVLAELKKSCDKYGIKLALYFSEGEWAWPNKPDGKRFQSNGGFNPEMKKAQLTELLTQYGSIEYIWFDHAVGDGGLNHAETVAFCKALQPGCFVGFNNGTAAGDIRLGEMGHPAPLTDTAGAGFNSGHMKGYTGYRLAEFTYPILPGHQGGAQWFYSLPSHDNLCFPAEKLYRDYLGAVKYGNIFSIDVGPDYNGKLRAIDVQTLQKVGEMIKNPPPLPVSQGKSAKASSVWGAGYGAGKAFDGDNESRWGAAPESRTGWIEVDLGSPMKVTRAVIDEGNWNRVRKFSLQCKDGDDWKTIVEGTTLGANKELKFPVLTARVFRLNITEAIQVPTIAEVQLFEK